MIAPLFFTSVGLLLFSAHTQRQSGVYVFKPLSTLLLLGAVALQPASPYQLALLLGLAFSLLGDILLMLPRDLFLGGLVSFLLAHVVYSWGLIGAGGGILHGGWLVLLVLAGGFLALLWPRVQGVERIGVPIYVALLVLMTGTAWGAHLAHPDSAWLLVGIGGLLFLVSDAVLAWRRYRGPFRGAEVVVLGTYYLAQWMLAQPVLP